jgi:lauroyl/myristoyl acyltransferase
MREASAALNDLEQLCYVGMRLAYPNGASRSAVRVRARACARRKLFALRQWMADDQPGRMQISGLEHLTSARELAGRAFIGSFQTGPYYRIPMALSEQGIPLSVLMDRASFEESMKRWNVWAQRYTGDLLEPVEFVDAEEPTAMWKLASALRKGRSAFAFFDGNTGMNPGRAQSALNVRLGKVTFPVRQGIAYLSWRTETPIVPAVAEFGPRKSHRLHLYPAISRRADEPAQDYCCRAFSYLFSVLERHLARDPAGWEPWYQVHQWSEGTRQSGAEVPDEAILELPLVADRGGYEILPMSDRTVAVSLNSHETILYTDVVRDALTRLRKPMTGRQLIGALTAKYGADTMRATLLDLVQTKFVSRHHDG